MFSLFLYKYLIDTGHAESWNTPTGKQIIRDLKEKDSFILFFVDECHQVGKKYPPVTCFVA